MPGEANPRVQGEVSITAAESPAEESTAESTEDRIRLDKISIRDFRNLERVDLQLPPDGAVIVGDNGHGKTHILEPIYYLQIMRSIRDARDQELTRLDAPGFHITSHAHTPQRRAIS